MGMIDLTAKNLMMLDDVFADIINGFVFLGEEKVKGEELTSLSEQSVYDSEDKILREQRRDLLKLWSKDSCAFALFGIENQDSIDKDMVLRVIGYDGASYRDQLKPSETSGTKTRYPVITLILYFGEKESLNFLSSFMEEVDTKELKNNLLDSYTAERRNKNMSKTIYEMVMEMWERDLQEKLAEKLAEKTDEVKAKIIAEGRAEGRAEGKNEAITNIAFNMKKDGFSVEKIIQLTGLSKDKVLNL